MSLKYTVSNKHEIYNMCDSEDVVSLLMKHFVCRKDVFAEQQTDGTYRPVRRELTTDDVRRHVNGEWTIGVYQLESGLVKWACFDIDAHNPGESTEARRKLHELTSRMIGLNIQPVIEPSGSDNSYHVWLLFSQLTEVSKAHYFCHELKGDNINCEVYPKQRENDPDKPYGNLVKLPKGKNLKNDAWSRFVPEPMVMIRTIDITQFATPTLRQGHELDSHTVLGETVVYTPSSDVVGFNQHNVVPTMAGNSLPMNVRPCIKRALDNHTQLTGAEGHAMRIAIVPEMRIVKGMNLNAVVLSFVSQGDYNYSRTCDQVNSVWKYNRISCSWLRKYAGGYVTDMCESCLFRGFA